MDPQKEFERAFMEGSLDPFDYELALELKIGTVEEMRDRMSNREYLIWRAFYVWRNAQRELNMKTIGKLR